MRAADFIGRFLAWWGEELASCVPGALRRAFTPAAPRLVLSFSDDRLDIIYERRRDSARSMLSLSRSDDLSARLRDYIERFGPRRGKVPIGLRIPLTWCLTRQLEIPYAARSNASGILLNDLQRATPFRNGQALSAVYLGERSQDGARITAHQVVVTRDRLAPLLEVAESAGLDVSFADAFSEDARRPLPIDLLAAPSESSKTSGQAWRWPAVFVLAVLAGAGLVGYAALDRQTQALARLEAMTEEVKTKALAVRKQMDLLESERAKHLALDQRKTLAPGVLGTWSELTRILPDTAWLETIRIDGDTVEITGYALSAAELVSLIEQSAMFKDAGLSSPVTQDDRVGAERFGVRLRFEETASGDGTSVADGASP